MVDLSGQTVGRYHIIEQLGQGGMATIYKAYDTRLEREVAIKFIRSGAIDPDHYEATIKRFEREAKSLAKLAHPNILQVHDYGEHEGSPYLVMSYIPGGTLKQKVGKPVRYTEAARLLLPIARALEYAHQRNIVHRDVKPANILLTESGEPMLSDFGIAKILAAGEATLTGSGVGIGTPEYMSPEQGIGHGVNQRTDVYALGMVFYELVTGRKAYTADTPAAVLIKQMTEPLPRPKNYVPELPNEVEQVIFKALAKNLENRYASMGEFANALEKLTVPVSATPQGFPEAKVTGITIPAGALDKSVLEGERAMAAPGAIVTAGPVAPATPAGETIDEVVPATPIPSVAPPRAERLQTAPPPKQKQEVSPMTRPVPQPARPAAAPKKRPWWIWVLGGVGVLIGVGCLVLLALFAIGLAVGGGTPTVEASQVTQLGKTVTVGAATPAQTSAPDATLAPTTPPASGLQVISPENINRISQIRRMGKGTNHQVVWSPDGKQLVLASSMGIYIYDAASLKETRYIDTDSWTYCVAVSPDGQTLAAALGNSTIKLYDLSNGEILKTLSDHTGQV